MSSKILISSQSRYFTKIAVIVKGTLADFHLYDKISEYGVGDLFFCRIEKKIPSQYAAIINYMSGKAGYLKLSKTDFKNTHIGDKVYAKLIRLPDNDKMPRFQLDETYSTQQKKVSDKIGIIKKNSLLDRVLKGIKPHLKGSEIIVDHINFYRDLSQQLVSEKFDIPIKYYENKDIPIFENEDIQEKIEALFEDKIEIDEGISLIFEEAETGTFIDINASSDDQRGSAEKHAFEVNKKACSIISEQIHQRRLSGILIIDFITMYKYEHRKVISSLIRESLLAHNSMAKTTSMSKFGIVEASLPYHSQSLSQMTKEACHSGGVKYKKISHSYLWDQIYFDFLKAVKSINDAVILNFPQEYSDDIENEMNVFFTEHPEFSLKKPLIKLQPQKDQSQNHYYLS